MYVILYSIFICPNQINHLIADMASNCTFTFKKRGRGGMRGGAGGGGMRKRKGEDSSASSSSEDETTVVR